MHMVSNRETLNEAEFETVRASKNPTVLMTANGEMLAKKVATLYVRELDLFVTVMLLEETPTVLSLVKPCEDPGYTFQWISSQKTHLIRHGKRIDCNMLHFVPCVAPGLSASSSSTTPYLHLLLHHLNHRILYFDVRRDAENPVPEKSGRTREELRGNPLHDSTETENKNQSEEREEVHRDKSHKSDLVRRIWVQLPLDEWPETTSRPKWKENSFRHQIMYRLPYLVYPRVHLPHQLLLHHHRWKLSDTEIPPTRNKVRARAHQHEETLGMHHRKSKNPQCT